MQFRNSNIDGEGTSPRGSQKATPQVNNASVITADEEDVLREARERNTTLESPLQHETVLHNWKKKAVNYGPYHEQEREYNKTFESPRDETALNNQKHEHEHTEVQLEQDLIDDLQSILEVLAEQNTQNKNELTGIKELLETVTKAQGNLAGRLEQVEPESAKIKEYDKKQGGGEDLPQHPTEDFISMTHLKFPKKISMEPKIHQIAMVVYTAIMQLHGIHMLGSQCPSMECGPKKVQYVTKKQNITPSP